MKIFDYSCFVKSTIKEYVKANNIDKPVFLLFPSIARYNVSYIKDKLQIPIQNIYYSVKTNSHPHLLKQLHNAGSGFEIASVNEWLLLKSLNIESSKIIFSNPVKMEQHISTCFTDGVTKFVVDSKNEIRKIARIAPESEIIIRVLTSNKGSGWKLNEKFGAPASKIVTLAKYAIANNLKISGITSHIGWNNTNILQWKKYFKKLINLASVLQKHQISIKFINIGGGFPAHNKHQYKQLDKIAKAVRFYLNYIKNTLKIDLIAEPGSFIADNAMAFVMQVYDIKTMNAKKWAFVNSGIMQGFPWILSKLHYKIYQLNLRKKCKIKQTYCITGPTNDSKDVFGTYKTNNKLTIGDYLVIYPAGAYTLSSNNYNGYQMPDSIICSAKNEHKIT